MSRLKGNEFVDLKLLGPDGKNVTWRGTAKIDSKNYSTTDFVVLKPHESVHASRIISLKDGTGFVLQESGSYSLRAEYSLSPREYFAPPIADGVEIPAESLASRAVTFCIESCDPNPQR